MIKSNELRIGNWVYGAPDSYEQCHNIMYDWESATPIQLTPEILEKCGFKNDFKVGRHADDFVNDVYSVMYKHAIVTKVKHLHQLQNLYYALTGEELTVEL